MEILFSRHGETDTNVNGKTHRRDDEMGLNAAGKLQSSKLADAAAKHNVRAIFTSPAKRAIETAQIVGRPLGLQPIVVDDLRERDWGDWNSEPWAEIEPRLKRMTLEERYTFIPLNGESWKQMDERLKRAVDKIAQTVTGNVMVITHGGALRAIVPNLKREELTQSLSYNFDNASVTSFSFSPPDTYAVLTENNTSHL